MKEKRFTNELKQVFDYIQNTILKEYDTDVITTEYFILSIFENDYSVANKVLSKVMLHDDIENAKAHFYEWLSQNAKKIKGTCKYDEVFEESVSDAKVMATKDKSKTINSGHMLCCIFNKNLSISKYFNTFGISANQLYTQVVEETISFEEEEKSAKVNKGSTPIRHVRKNKEKETVPNNTKETIVFETDRRNERGGGICEKLFVNLNQEAKKTQIDGVVCNKKIYDNIFNTLSKRNKNNVIIVGKDGIGKTSTVRNLANLINEGNVPKPFLKKTLLQVDFNTLYAGTAMRGTLETRIDSIVNDAKQNGEYIFFIDSLNTLYKNATPEEDISSFIETIAKEKNIMVICTSSESGYNTCISNNPSLENSFEKIPMEIPGDEECIEILRYHAKKLGYFHYVNYEESVFPVCVKLCKRYMTEKPLPDCAIDIMDKVGAKVALSVKDNDDITELRNEISTLESEMKEIKYSSSEKNYDKIEEMEKKCISMKSEMEQKIKEQNLERQPALITPKHIRECISIDTGVNISDLTVDDKTLLKHLNERIKNVVIGQDEAVDSMCRAIKRQRVGISNPNKPIVFLMAGSTGVGKTYLAKTIAKEVFGDENKLVRLDMSEYSSSMGTSSLIGSGKGYIGYESGGILTEAVKKHKQCVLLLDEIEKAHEEVHNLFLSLFDDGRLTDNKGVTVDFKNVIIIMTSNVGAKELDERGNGIGFVTNQEQVKKDIIEKELKRKFRPEFINRIDKIVYFNKLTDDNIKKIISLELRKVQKRIKDNGFILTDDMLDNVFLPKIYKNIEKKRNMGARPIVREIQNELEDRLTDLIIENDLEKGHIFTEKELNN